MLKVPEHVPERGQPGGAERPVGELVHQLVEDGKAYARAEIGLAKAIAAGAKLGVNDRTVPFWDPALLAANDAAFQAPTEATVAALRDDHGVRWLFADLATTDPAELARVADLRYQAGQYAVYAVRASP